MALPAWNPKKKKEDEQVNNQVETTQTATKTTSTSTGGLPGWGAQKKEESKATTTPTQSATGTTPTPEKNFFQKVGDWFNNTFANPKNNVFETEGEVQKTPQLPTTKVEIPTIDQQSLLSMAATTKSKLASTDTFKQDLASSIINNVNSDYTVNFENGLQSADILKKAKTPITDYLQLQRDVKSYQNAQDTLTGAQSKLTVDTNTLNQLGVKTTTPDMLKTAQDTITTLNNKYGTELMQDFAKQGSGYIDGILATELDPQFTNLQTDLKVKNEETAATKKVFSEAMQEIQDNPGYHKLQQAIGNFQLIPEGTVKSTDSSLSTVQEINKESNILLNSVMFGLTSGRVGFSSGETGDKDLFINPVKPESEGQKNLAVVGTAAGAILQLTLIGKLVGGLGVVTDAADAIAGIKSAPWLAKIFTEDSLNSMASFATSGQLKPDMTIGDRATEFAQDLGSGLVFSKIGGIKKAYVSLPINASIGALSAKMEGKSDQEALTSAAIFAGMDLVGRVKFAIGGENQINQVFKERAVEVLNGYGKDIPGYRDISLDTSPKELKSTWRELIKTVHPKTSEQVASDTGDSEIVNTAYRILSGQLQINAPFTAKEKFNMAMTREYPARTEEYTGKEKVATPSLLTAGEQEGITPEKQVPTVEQRVSTTTTPAEELVKTEAKGEVAPIKSVSEVKSAIEVPTRPTTAATLKEVAVPDAPKGYSMNIGMKVGKTDVDIPEKDITDLLKNKYGVDILTKKIEKSETENTLVIKTSRPLSLDEMHQLTVDLKQEAIGQMIDGIGMLHGDQKAIEKNWGGGFNNDYYFQPPQITEETKIATTPEVKSEVQTVTVPRSQLPVASTGKEKVSKLEARVKKVLDKVTPDQAEALGITKYKEMNNKDIIKAASEYVIKNPNEAMEVLRGNMDAPKGLPRNAIYVAMVNSSSDDLELATKLATLQSTRFGQEIEILKELNPFAPATLIDTANKQFKIAIEERYGKDRVAKTIKEEKEKITEKIKKETPRTKVSRSAWEKFIDEIQCK